MPSMHIAPVTGVGFATRAHASHHASAHGHVDSIAVRQLERCRVEVAVELAECGRSRCSDTANDLGQKKGGWGQLRFQPFQMGAATMLWPITVASEMAEVRSPWASRSGCRVPKKS